jgi:flagellin-like protein
LEDIMRKGITPIIAIIVLLLITVALAGAAWTYLSTYMSGLTGQSVEVRDYFCTGGDTATIIIANTGTIDIPVADVTILDTSDGNEVSGTWTAPDGTTINPTTGEIGVGSYATWKNDSTNPAAYSCDPNCALRVVGGTARAQLARINC